MPLPQTADQLGLFAARGEGIDRAFWEFHYKNPTIYEKLVQYARQAKAAGRVRFGVSMLWERLRWYTLVETTDKTGLKLNNNYRSRYARLLMLRERCRPDCPGCRLETCLAGLFETRELQTTSSLPGELP